LRREVKTKGEVKKIRGRKRGEKIAEGPGTQDTGGGGYSD